MSVQAAYGDGEYTRWPTLNYSNPETATEHVRALRDDFNAISVVLEAHPTAQIPRHLFDTIYRSYLGLQYKLIAELQQADAINSAKSAQRLSGPSVGHQENGPQDGASNQGEDAVSCGASSSAEEISQPSECPEPRDSFSFNTFLTDEKMIERLKYMNECQLRALVYRAANKKIGAFDTPIGAPWTFSVTLQESDHLHILCHTREERDALVQSGPWRDNLEAFLKQRLPGYAVVMQKVPLKSLRLQNASGSQMSERIGELVEANSSHIPGLKFKRHVQTFRWLGLDEGGTKEHMITDQGNKRHYGPVMRQAVVEFAQPMHANDAILHGLKWNGITYSCVRMVEHDEIDRCFECLQYGHNSTPCPFGPRCVRCFGGHKIQACPGLIEACAFCGERHRKKGKICEPIKRTIEPAKRIVRSREPFFQISNGSTTPESSLGILYPANQGRQVTDTIAPTKKNSGRLHEVRRRIDMDGEFPSPMASASKGPAYDSTSSSPHSGNISPQAVLQKLDDHQKAILHQITGRASSPPQVATLSAAAHPSKKRKAASPTQPRRISKSSNRTTTVQFPEVKKEPEDPVQKYIRDNNCVPVNQGEGLRDALVRAGKLENSTRGRGKETGTWYQWIPYDTTITRRPSSHITNQGSGERTLL